MSAMGKMLGGECGCIALALIVFVLAVVGLVLWGMLMRMPVA
jgi:hypothetical protein